MQETINRFLTSCKEGDNMNIILLIWIIAITFTILVLLKLTMTLIGVVANIVRVLERHDIKIGKND